MQRQFLRYDAAVGYTFVPHLKTRIAHEGGGYLLRTNAQGFRCDHDFRAEPVPGRRRVLLFGDSYTAGDGVSNGARYGDLLEQSDPSLQVYNFGLPGTGTDQQYLAYRQFARAMPCDLLVIAVLVENLRRIAARYRPFQDAEGRTSYFAKPYFLLQDGVLATQSVPVPQEPLSEQEAATLDPSTVDRGGHFALLRRAVNLLGVKDMTQRLTGYQPLPEYDRDDHPHWLLLRAVLEAWVREHAGPVLLVPLPLYQYVEESSDPTAYQRRFAEAAADLGCRLHDPLPDLLAYPRAERRRFRFEHDVHPTRAGHQALARSLAPAVAAVLQSTAAPRATAEMA
jgi:hypothetical protein